MQCHLMMVLGMQEGTQGLKEWSSSYGMLSLLCHTMFDPILATTLPKNPWLLCKQKSSTWSILNNVLGYRIPNGHNLLTKQIPSHLS